MVLVGWGGWVSKSSGGAYSSSLSIAYAKSLVTQLANWGYNAIRYEAIAPFLGASTMTGYHTEVLDALVTAAAARGMTVIIDRVHNYPPPSTSITMQNNYSGWFSALKSAGQRYNGKGNVILECVNEYVRSDAKTKFQRLVTDLRAAGVKLPLHFNYMWTDQNKSGSIGTLIPPIDPLNRLTIGHHHYATKTGTGSNVAMYSGESWSSYCSRVGVEATVKSMMTSTSSLWYGYARAKGTKLLMTEVGPTYNTGETSEYNRYNVAYARRLTEYARKYNVGCIHFRCGYQEDLPLTRSRWQSYFGVSLGKTFEQWSTVA